jgi:hypothetical protein
MTQSKVAEGDDIVREVGDCDVREVAGDFPNRFIEHRFNDVVFLFLHSIPQVLLGEIMMQNPHIIGGAYAILELGITCRSIDECKVIVLCFQAELRFVFIVDRDVERRSFVNLDGNAERIDEVTFNSISPLMKSKGEKR